MRKTQNGRKRHERENQIVGERGYYEREIDRERERARERGGERIEST